MTTATERILRAVEDQRSQLLAALTEAIRIPSVSPRFPGEDPERHRGREGDVARLVAGLLEPVGCEVDLFAVEEGRENCVATLRGTGGGRSLILNGHVDVVPPQPAEQWTGADPWSGRVADGRVWGRGAADMKGGLLCAAFAVRAIAAAGARLRGDLILQAVVGEELMEAALGTLACLERGYRADAAVVAEPSPAHAPLAVCPASCGFLLLSLTVEGKPTHSGMRAETIRPGRSGSAQGVHAIDKAIPIYLALAELERQWGMDKHDPLFLPGSFTVHPGVFVGGPRDVLVPYAIAEHARMECVVWYPPQEDAAAIRAEIERQVASAAALDPWLRDHPPQLTWSQHWPPARLNDPEHAIVAAACDAHERANGAPAMRAGFTAVADTAFLNEAGIPAISYGPGSLSEAHAADESVAVDELLAATRTYALLAADWCDMEAT